MASQVRLRAGWVRLSLIAGPLLAALPAFALDIQNGNYSKNNPNYVRVMTWNVFQRLGDPGEANTPWTSGQMGSPVAAINLIVTALDPDIIVFQECGDIGSNPSYNTVLSNMQQWRNTNRPGYSLFLGNEGGSIHCAILSRWPMASIDGDGISTHHDIPALAAGPGGDWPTGGDGGLRGWVQAEVNLPDANYLGNLYVGCSHFKAGGTQGDEDDRIIAAKNIAAYIQYALNLGNDPFNIIPGTGEAQLQLSANTPVVWAGDFNTANGNTPVNILRSHNTGVLGDGTDRDGGDSWRSDAATAFNGTSATHDGGSRLDWVLLQDGIPGVSANAAFIFDTGRIPKILNTMQTQYTPPNMLGLLNNSLINSVASDHFPVIADIVLPTAVSLTSVQITGPVTVDSGQAQQYTGTAFFSDASQQDITNTGTWSIVSGPATINSTGLFTANVVPFDNSADIMLSYTSGTTQTDTHNVAVPSVCDRYGDVNGDTLIDGNDIIAFTEVFAGAQTDPMTVCRANMDNSLAIDEIDADLLTLALLGLL